MKHSLKSNLDLLAAFPSNDQTATDDLVPTLIYSGTRARTFTVLEVLDMARKTPDACRNAKNMFARRYHSSTGDKDKEDCVRDFADGRFPIISATMALGLGQNWKRVRSVIHMGRGDPANICQMIGRCGRDGAGGLAVLFMESNRKGGKNVPGDFTEGDIQSDNDRMDALVITPVCLRVALYSMDNKYGYIPVSKDDPNYITEVRREKSLGFPQCRCSNCMVEEGDTLIKNLHHLNKSNFDDALMDRTQFPMTEPLPNKRITRSAPNDLVVDNPELAANFQCHLIEVFRNFYEEKMGTSGRFSASELFNEHHATSVIKNLPNIDKNDDLNTIIGGETIDGQVELLMNTISNFRNDPMYHKHMEQCRALKLEREELKRQKRREYGIQYRANKQARLAAERQEEKDVRQTPCPEVSNIEEGLEDVEAARKQEEDAEAARKKEVEMIKKMKKREYAAQYRANKKARLQAAKEGLVSVSTTNPRNPNDTAAEIGGDY
ncbi:ATP-dependent DNA helicase sgs1 [Puccinia graminis f. sp. tritici]|uniref:DNA 3'-5' helicase n=1 Tax=Puccinia graminis f. sp. tritici TaxID=56615 RepID=A0A5B0Q339_PUCGR|nr:ATP-dependent DNA helicase sgs1 [Puccinia graminis f. sp. tritici]KAA1124660.1 ATP-dependent DNA helicase sgs1 [Puccinia graminis f. sp. tritici]